MPGRQSLRITASGSLFTAVLQLSNLLPLLQITAGMKKRTTFTAGSDKDPGFSRDSE